MCLNWSLNIQKVNKSPILWAMPIHLPDLSLEEGHSVSWSIYRTCCQKVNWRYADMSGVTLFKYCNGVISSGKLGSMHMLCIAATYWVAIYHRESGASVMSSRI